MTANEEHLFEVDLIVKAPNQPDARIRGRVSMLCGVRFSISLVE